MFIPLHVKYQRAAMLLSAALAFGACGPKNDTPRTSDSSVAMAPAKSASDARQSAIADSSSGRNMSGRAGDVGGASATTPVAGQLDDAGIIAFILAVDESEAKAGELASRKASRSAVKAFAREMVQAHRADRTKVRSLARAASIMAADSGTSASMPLLEELHRGDSITADQLKSASGTEFDRMYIDAQIAGHEKVLGILRASEASLRNDTVKAHVTGLQQVVSAHLEKARGLQQPLGSAR
jgi:putative membrane protein